MSVFTLEGLLKMFFPRPARRTMLAPVPTILPSVIQLAGCVNNTALTTGALTANVLRAMPFWAPPHKSTIDRIRFEVTTGSANNARVGLYQNVADEDSHYPGALLADSGNISTTPAAIKTYDTSVELTPNRLYWLALVNSASVTYRLLQAAGVTPILGIAAALAGTNNLYNTGIQVAHTFGALPDPFTAAGTYDAGTTQPALGYRFGA